MKNDSFAGFGPERSNYGTSHDDLTGLKGLAESGKEIGGVADNIDHVAGQRFQPVIVWPAAINRGTMAWPISPRPRKPIFKKHP